MNTILLFGGSGMVGSYVQQKLSNSYTFLSPTKSDVDLTDYTAVKDFLGSARYNFIIYSAGITNPDAAIENKELALKVNTSAPGWISDISKKKNIPVCYLSTDAVFDGTQKDRPYREDDDPHPINFYGETKLRGEEEVLGRSENNVVLRLINVFSPKYEKKLDFARKELSKLKLGEAVLGISDQVSNPLYVDIAALAIDEIIRSHASGVYHLGAKDFASNLELTKKIAKEFGYQENLIHVTSLDVFNMGKKEPRASFCWLDVTRFERDFGNGILKTIDESIKQFHHDYLQR